MSVAYAHGGVFLGRREIPSPAERVPGRELEQGPVPPSLLRSAEPRPTPAPAPRPSKEKQAPTPPRPRGIPLAKPASPPSPPLHPACPKCGGKNRSKGTDRMGGKRYMCVDCGKTNYGDRLTKNPRPCPSCSGKAYRYGTTGADRRPRFRCLECRRVWSIPREESER